MDLLSFTTDNFSENLKMTTPIKIAAAPIQVID